MTIYIHKGKASELQYKQINTVNGMAECTGNLTYIFHGINDDREYTLLEDDKHWLLTDKYSLCTLSNRISFIDDINEKDLLYDIKYRVVIEENCTRDDGFRLRCSDTWCKVSLLPDEYADAKLNSYVSRCAFPVIKSCCGKYDASELLDRFKDKIKLVKRDKHDNIHMSKALSLQDALAMVNSPKKRVEITF